MERDFLKNFVILTRKHMRQSLIFVKVAGWVGGSLSKNKTSL